MKILLINLGSTTIHGLDKAFTNDLMESVTGNSLEDIAEDTKQFIDTWGPDLLIIAETPTLPASNGAKPTEDLSAASIIEILRKEKLLNQPVIFVGNAQDTKALRILEAGAQALIPVSLDSGPNNFAVNSQLLRTQAINLTNLAKGQATKDFKLGAITILQDSREIFISSYKVPLTRSEAKLFITLVLAGGRTVTKENLFNQLYSYDSYIELKIIDVFVCRTRAKLDAAFKPLGYDSGMIATAWGRGYFIDTNKVPGLEERSRFDLLPGTSQASAIPISPARQLPPPSAERFAPVSRENEELSAQLKDRVPRTERTLPEKPIHKKSETLGRIKSFLALANFQERDADIAGYVNLAKRAIQEDHSTQELFTLFAGCFKPLWREGGIVDPKAFTYLIQNPERLHLYRIDREAVEKVPMRVPR